MKSFDRPSLDEQMKLVSRYVAGDLSRSERAEFEAWLVASPELAAEVEMERRLRRGIASAARRGWLKRGLPPPVAQDRRWRVAIAASLLVTAAVGWSVLMPEGAADSPTTARAPGAKRLPIVTTRTVRLSAVRGPSSIPDLMLSRAEAPTELVIEPDVVALTCEDGTIELECPGGAAPLTPQYPEYEFEVINRQGATLVWQSPRQMPIAGAQLSFRMRDPGNLAVGDYDMIVRGHSPAHEEVIARFWLRITQ